MDRSAFLMHSLSYPRLDSVVNSLLLNNNNQWSLYHASLLESEDKKLSFLSVAAAAVAVAVVAVVMVDSGVLL